VATVRGAVASRLAYGDPIAALAGLGAGRGLTALSQSPLFVSCSIYMLNKRRISGGGGTQKPLGGIRLTVYSPFLCI